MLYVIGDVHGCAFELRELLNKLPLTPGSTIVFVGDYIDRGPRSREVIDTILELKRYCQVVALMGNHEAMFLNFLEQPQSPKAVTYIYNGGSATLASYSSQSGEYEVPDDHMEFYRTLRLFYETNDFFFVHAGVPDMPLEELNPYQHADRLLWTRRPFLNSTFKWSKIIVHGHTPVESVDITPTRINLDTGCVFDNRLSAVALPSREIISVRKQAQPRRVYLRDATSRREAVRFRGAAPVTITHGSVDYQFETIDYSELGMYIRDMQHHATYLFQRGELVRGTVGADELPQITFHAEVVRREKHDDGIYYGLKVLVRS